MKKIILVMFTIVLLFGCGQMEDVEIIKNYDNEYIEVATQHIVLQSLIPSETKKLMNSDVNEIFSKTKCVTENIPENYLYVLFIGQNGEIEKIEVPSVLEPTENISMIDKMKNWEFGKYVVEGESKKYRMTITVMKVTRSDGNTFATTIGNEGDVITGKVFLVAVEEMPEPIGGIGAIQKNITYPEIAKRAGVEGRVYVKAYVDSTGTVVKTELLRGIGAGCDEVAMAAVDKVKFMPGKQNGKVVNTQVTIPILFKLQ